MEDAERRWSHGLSGRRALSLMMLYRIARPIRGTARRVVVRRLGKLSSSSSVPVHWFTPSAASRYGRVRYPQRYRRDIARQHAR